MSDVKIAGTWSARVVNFRRSLVEGGVVIGLSVSIDGMFLDDRMSCELRVHSHDLLALLNTLVFEIKSSGTPEEIDAARKIVRAMLGGS